MLEKTFKQKNRVDRKGKKCLDFQENEYSKINLEYAEIEKKKSITLD